MLGLELSHGSLKRVPGHDKGCVVILVKCLSLAALKVVISTTFNAASDEHFVKMIVPFQWSSRMMSHAMEMLSALLALCEEYAHT